MFVKYLFSLSGHELSTYFLFTCHHDDEDAEMFCHKNGHYLLHVEHAKRVNMHDDKRWSSGPLRILHLSRCHPCNADTLIGNRNVILIPDLPKEIIDNYKSNTKVILVITGDKLQIFSTFLNLNPKTYFCLTSGWFFLLMLAWSIANTDFDILHFSIGF